MKNTSEAVWVFLESAEVAKIVGIPPIYLNKFVERRKYRIEPSVRSGKGRGSRRLFSEDDVYGIALVWWLFEAGLRSDTIQDVLDQICRTTKGKRARANDAAKKLFDEETHVLAIKREPRTSAKAGSSGPSLEVFQADWSAANDLVDDADTASVLFIPVEGRFARMWNKYRTGGKPPGTTGKRK